MEQRMHFQTLLEETIGNTAGHTAIEYFVGKEKKKVSGDAYLTHIQAMANYLNQRMQPLEPGSWVALKAPNSVYWFGVMFALMKCGYRVMLLDAQNPHQLDEHFVAEAGVKAFLTHRPTGIPGVLDVDIAQVEGVDDQKILSDPTSYPPVGDDRWADKVSFHTSGTTGTAKAYVFAASAIVGTVRNVTEYWLGNDRITQRSISTKLEEHKSLLALPFRHISGFLLVVTFWHMGHCVIFPPNSGVFSIIDTCKQENIWMMFCVPAMWKGFIRIAQARYGGCGEQEFQQLLGENLKVGISAGAKLDAESVKVLLHSGIYFLNSWGMTEIGTSTMGGIDEDPSTDYVGCFYNKHKAKILLEDGTYVDNGVGELVLDGHSLYESILIGGKEVFREGPFRSGDIFKLDGQRTYFLGRCKSVIVTDSGENIYPEEIDVYFDFLNDFSSGYCTAGYQDQVTLFVSPKDYDNFEETECFAQIRKVNAGLPMNKKVTKLYAFHDPLPRTGKGEVARFQMAHVLEERADGVKEIKMKGRNV